VDWQHKKIVGPLAYVLAGIKAVFGAQSPITVTASGHALTGELVLIGNGARYGGDYRLFPGADFRDGQLDACVFPRVTLWVALGHGLSLLTRGGVRETKVQRVRTAEFTLTSPQPTPFEVEGELAGHLPARFGVTREKLRVIVP
jgi:diacylglycerol kinase family enzyme